MLREHKQKLNRIFRTADLIIILISFWAAYYLRFGISPLFKDLPIQFKVFFPAYLIAWLYLSHRFELYRSRRMEGFKKETWEVVKSATICLIMAEVVGFFLRDLPLSRIFLLALWIIQSFSLILFRLSVRAFLKYIRKHGYNFRNILIVGRNDRSDTFLKRIKELSELGVQVLGFIDGPNGFHGQPPEGNSLGELKDLETILRNQVVDEVFVFLPIKTFYSEIKEVLHVCEKAGIEVKIPTDLFSRNFARAKVSIYADLPVIDFYTSPKMNMQLMVKGLLDFIVSAIFLLLFSPLFLVVSVLIKATCEGPVFFKQSRVGYNGRIFSCLKFRTMIRNADEMKKELLALNEMDGPVFKIRKDPRVTKVGRFLRKTSIDELPQLINALIGDMSLVGPRPPVPEEVKQYDLEDRRRLSMRPGITCLWQVNGRSNVSFKDWMKLDMEYIDKWSLLLDFKILAKTISAVLKSSGAT
jgi:exopolysaccharide biosynthesis polyprenyl glycosylphosphotransferase